MLTQRGVTLTEVLVATTIAVIVVVGFTLTDLGRSRIEQDLRKRAGPRIAQIKPTLALQHLAQRLEQADRLIIVNSGTPGGFGILRVRRAGVGCPEPIQPTCYTTAAGFVWEEYRRNGTNLEFVEIPGGVCAAPTVLSDNVTSLTFRFADESPCQPFGVSGPQDNNTLAYVLTWNDGTQQQEFVGQMTSRLISCSTLPSTSFDPGTGTGDSGIGLAPVGVSDPPAACP